ncbi:hypothetical protein V7024_19650 [Bacillus sp. JJ864]
MHKIINIIYGLLLVVYTLYSFFMKDESDLKIIILLTVLLIVSVSLEKSKIKN